MESPPKQQRDKNDSKESRADSVVLYRPPGATEENWENIMQAIHVLHRGNTTREKEVNSRQNSDARGRPDTNPRAPSRDRVESGIQEHNSFQDNHSSPLGDSPPNRTTISVRASAGRKKRPAWITFSRLSRILSVSSTAPEQI